MITPQNMATEAERKALVQLAARFPHGAVVRHETGTVGTVADDYPRNRHGMGLDVAHAVIAGGVMGVCVQMTIDGHQVTCWYDPAVLTIEARPGRQRQRTTRRAA